MHQQHTGTIVVVCKTPSFQMFPLLAINAHAVRNTTVCGFFPHHKTAATEFEATVPRWKIRRLQVELQPLSGLVESCAIECNIKLHRQTNETKVKLS